MSETKSQKIEREKREAEEKNAQIQANESGKNVTVGDKTFTPDTEKKKAGRMKKTDKEFDNDFSDYQERMKKRNLEIEAENIKNPENALKNPVLKVLDRTAWDKSKPTGEKSEEIFIRLAKSRMPKILNTFDNISSLAKYEHTEGQGEKIVNDLLKAVEKVKIAFSMKSENKEIEDYQI